MKEPNTSTPDPHNEDTLRPLEGWHVLHLFYQIERGGWSLLDAQQQREQKTAFTELVREVRSHPDTQLLLFSMVSPKADLGMMLLTPDLHDLNTFEKRLSSSLTCEGSEILQATYSYLSLTERSEYTTSSEQYAQGLIASGEHKEDTDELKEAVATFEKRMEHYLHDRLYPNMPDLPDWPLYCFYPMSKRRNPEQNWYALEKEERHKLMQGHAKIGRQWTGKIRQLITGSVGLDEAEWGVTLFARNSSDIKDIVYEMRFDEVSAQYAEFGDFYIGIQLPLKDLLDRLLF